MNEKLRLTIQNVKVLVDAAWGASTGKSILRSGIEAYLKRINQDSEFSYNPGDEVILLEFFQRISRVVEEKNHSRESLLMLPWNSRKIELPRLVKALIAFSDDHGKETVPEFFPVGEIFKFLGKIKCQFQETKKNLNLIDQLDIALHQTDGHPVAAAIIAHSSYRVLRNCDTRLDPRFSFELESDTKQITQLSIAQSTADFAMTDIKDPLGNTYHWWSQFSFAMTSFLFKPENFIQVNVYNSAFHLGPELTRGIRNKLLGMPLAAGDHREVDRQGMRIGRAIGALVMNRLN